MEDNKKESKERADNYDPKLKVNKSFAQVVKAVAKHKTKKEEPKIKKVFGIDSNIGEEIKKVIKKRKAKE